MVKQHHLTGLDSRDTIYIRGAAVQDLAKGFPTTTLQEARRRAGVKSVRRGTVWYLVPA